MRSPNPIPGQRWISDNEPSLGLGVILGTRGRLVDILFPACAEKRTYAGEGAPLTRVVFAPGDPVEDQSGTPLRVKSIIPNGGLVNYLVHTRSGKEQVLPEQQLSGFLLFSQPQQRLFAAQLDDPGWFDLRFDTLELRQHLEHSPTRGLGGARIALLPHQLYIAREVGHRHSPRILLADEVGLGKTIEAGLILHHQLLTGRASRILILAPASLLNQWLVELLRRFNLRFSLFDEERYQAIEHSDQRDNPFLAEQQVLTSLELFTGHPHRLEQAAMAGWDMLIVDEAHHLEWNEQQASEPYRLVQRLSAVIPSVLLLTATPEQLGRSGHFARLRLLDPDRFHSLSVFEREAQRFEPVADAVNQLLEERPLTEAACNTLNRLLDSPGERELIAASTAPDHPNRELARRQLIGRLLDRHGTGRVLFRNTRAQVQGFPARELHAFPLPLPEEYRLCLASDIPSPMQRLAPETLERGSASPPWWELDPRVPWLEWRLSWLPGEKILLICASNTTAVELATALRVRAGIYAGIFHAGSSIVERDRAAVWFADPEDGCQLLICSEIGSEGRNFQFSSHLVLFDLPLDPDLLEQRIGRLDRIGQDRTIQIHVPYFENSAQSVMLNWYHQGLDAFRNTCPAGHLLFSRLQPALLEMLESSHEEPVAMGAFLAETTRLNEDIQRELRNGRDRLLEYHSCREPEATQLRQNIEQVEQELPLADYLERVLSVYGVDSEVLSDECLILKQGPQMLTDSFPGLPEAGITCTLDRQTALTHEAWQFLTWEHPLVSGAMEMVAEGTEGSSCVSAIRHPALRAGEIALEILLAIESPAPRRLAIGRFLQTTLLRLLIDQRLEDRGEDIARNQLRATRCLLDATVARRLVTSLRPPLERMLSRGRELAEARLPGYLENARTVARNHYDEEVSRLEALRRVNPNVRAGEIQALKDQARELAHHLDSAHLRLDALHVVIGL
ncbi:MAG: RNA polymerase-associated protein RapA [Gammaproteobacteria bacterium]|nr:RNA polymerase-associated protein RapA [Gammaproteobacteria bacterium]